MKNCSNKNCSRENPQPLEEFVLNHKGADGMVRGLLCSACNRMIGFAQDRVEILQNGVFYLKGFLE